MTTVDEPHDRQRTAVLVLVVIVVTAGIAIRLWIARTPSIGYPDSDEAVPGLMALHMLRGEIPTFYWGQNYGGTPEVGLLAAVFWVFGSSVAALRAVPIALYGLAALLLWRIGRRTIGEPCATYAALLFWIRPAYFVWRSTREYGYYGVLLVCGLGLVLVALNNLLVDASSRPARIFVTGTGEEPAERPGLLAAGYRAVRAGPFTVFLPPH